VPASRHRDSTLRLQAGRYPGLVALEASLTPDYSYGLEETFSLLPHDSFSFVTWKCSHGTLVFGVALLVYFPCLYHHLHNTEMHRFRYITVVSDR
jgi:hypothetical protein